MLPIKQVELNPRHAEAQSVDREKGRDFTIEKSGKHHLSPTVGVNRFKLKPALAGVARWVKHPCPRHPEVPGSILVRTHMPRLPRRGCAGGSQQRFLSPSPSFPKKIKTFF